MGHAMNDERGRHEVVLTGVPASSVKIDIVNFLCNIDIDEDTVKIAESSAYNGTKEVWEVKITSSFIDDSRFLFQ